MNSVLEIIKKSTDFLAARGVENARLNAECLMGHALGLKRMQLYVQFERPLTESELERMRPLVRRRAAREPLQYILGEVVFSGLTLKCDRRALIPRPETEYLVEWVTGRLRDAPPARILDLGTGSGAIALALAQAFPAAVVTAVDRSPEALSLARENAAALGMESRVQFLESTWYAGIPVGERFDLIVSNPPYLSTAEVADSQPEVREFEPRSALVAEEGGRADLEAIIRGAAGYLAPGGWLALETGIAQHALLRAAVEAAGLRDFESVPDLTKRDRFVLARV